MSWGSQDCGQTERQTDNPRSPGLPRAGTPGGLTWPLPPREKMRVSELQCRPRLHPEASSGFPRSEGLQGPGGRGCVCRLLPPSRRPGAPGGATTVPPESSVRGPTSHTSQARCLAGNSSLIFRLPLPPTARTQPVPPQVSSLHMTAPATATEATGGSRLLLRPHPTSWALLLTWTTQNLLLTPTLAAGSSQLQPAPGSLSTSFTPPLTQSPSTVPHPVSARLTSGLGLTWGERNVPCGLQDAHQQPRDTPSPSATT